MSSANKKILNLLVAVFIAAWLISATHLGMKYLQPETSSSAGTELTAVTSSTTSTSPSRDNATMLFTSFVGVIHYLYKK